MLFNECKLVKEFPSHIFIYSSLDILVRPVYRGVRVCGSKPPTPPWVLIQVKWNFVFIFCFKSFSRGGAHRYENMKKKPLRSITVLKAFHSKGSSPLRRNPLNLVLARFGTKVPSLTFGGKPPTIIYTGIFFFLLNGWHGGLGSLRGA